MDIRDFFVILASGSPRRIEMLRAEGIDPLVIKSSCSEDIRLDLTPACFVMSLAFRKGQSVLEQVQESVRSGPGGSERIGLSCFGRPAESGLPVIPDKPVLMISADTIVYKDGRIIGKPVDEADAFRILSDLRDAVNSVYSGVCLRVLDEGFRPVRSILFAVRTDVRLGYYADDYIRSYIASGEPMDKAGAYAIQGTFGVNVTGYDGPRDNVIGFPLERIKAELTKL